MTEQTMDNQLPSPLDDLKNRLDDATASIKARIKNIAVALEKVPEVINEAIEGAVVDQVGQAKLALRDLEEMRKKNKKPIDDMATAVQDHFKGIASIVSVNVGIKPGPLERVLSRLTKYQVEVANEQRRVREAEKRRADAEAERLAKEAAEAVQKAAQTAREAQTEPERQKAADAIEVAQQLTQRAETASEAAVTAAKPAASLGRVAGAGAKSHLTGRPVYSVKDLDLVPRFYLTIDDAKVKSAIAAGMENIPGLEIREEFSATITAGR